MRYLLFYFVFSINQSFFITFYAKSLQQQMNADIYSNLASKIFDPESILKQNLTVHEPGNPMLLLFFQQSNYFNSKFWSNI